MENGILATIEGVFLTYAQKKNIEDKKLKDLKANNLFISNYRLLNLGNDS